MSKVYADDDDNTPNDWSEVEPETHGKNVRNNLVTSNNRTNKKILEMSSSNKDEQKRVMVLTRNQHPSSNNMERNNNHVKGTNRQYEQIPSIPDHAASLLKEEKNNECNYEERLNHYNKKRNEIFGTPNSN
ncbi:hypothetical protein SNEBB_003127 [Seison nebaliae]|nr:hypothetical protein SNEBB_003127 [Seison nebaliae]